MAEFQKFNPQSEEEKDALGERFMNKMEKTASAERSAYLARKEEHGLVGDVFKKRGPEGSGETWMWGEVNGHKFELDFLNAKYTIDDQDVPYSAASELFGSLEDIAYDVRAEQEAADIMQNEQRWSDYRKQVEEEREKKNKKEELGRRLVGEILQGLK